MQGVHLRKYGVEAKFDFELYEVDGVDFRVDAVDAGSDCSVMKDEGAEATCTNDFVDEGKGYSITLTATEMEAARITVYIVDSATKVWLDKSITIETYGHASAEHAMDFSDAVRGGMTALPNAAADAAGGLPISDDGGLDLDSMNSQIETNFDDIGDVRAIVDEIVIDTGETQSKLPVNKFMGSSDGADDDGTLNTINTNAARLTAVRAAVLTDLIDGGRLDLLVDAIKAKTDNLPADPADDSDIDAQLAAIAGYLDTEIAAIKSKTDNIPGSPAAIGSAMTLAADAVSAAALKTDAITEIITAMFAKTGITVGGVVSFNTIVKSLYSMARGKISKAGDSYTFYDDDDATALFVLTIAAASRTVV